MNKNLDEIVEYRGVTDLVVAEVLSIILTAIPLPVCVGSSLSTSYPLPLTINPSLFNFYFKFNNSLSIRSELLE